MCDFVSTLSNSMEPMSCNYDLLWILITFYRAYRIPPPLLLRSRCPSEHGYITARSHGRPVSSWRGALFVLWIRLWNTAWHLRSSFNSLRNFPLRSIYNTLLTSPHTSGNIFRLNICINFSFPTTSYMSRPAFYPVLCWFWCREMGTSSIDSAQLSRFSPEDGDRVQSPKTFY
jgi:hypothetical protein